MKQSQSILAIIEPELNPHETVQRAAWLAAMYDQPLVLMLCDPDVGPLHAGWYQSNEAKEIGENIAAAQQEFMDGLADIAKTSGVDVTTVILEHRPVADAIINEVRERNPALVIKATHYHSAAQRAIFVDTDWYLLRACPCPLYFTKPAAITEKADIIAAVDPTHAHDKSASLDREIVSSALDLAARTGGEVHLLHTYQRIAGVGREATKTFKPIRIPLHEVDARIRTEHRQKLDELAKEFDIKPDHVHQLPGATRDLLPTFARTHAAGVVVMGGLARWSLKRAVIGSTVERVLDSVPCDILIVRQPANE
ncbi:MAG: universal stress protein [Pseudomonadales bacterium]